jgi:hypothetical protein
MYCNRDLCEDAENSSVIYLKDTTTKKIIDFYWVCDGDCEVLYGDQYEGLDVKETKECLADLMIPSNYLSWSLANLDVVKSQYGVYEDEAYRNLRKLFLTISQFVFRDHTLADIRRINKKVQK